MLSALPHVGDAPPQPPYILVTELMYGGSLQDALDQHVQFSVRRALEMALDCARGSAPQRSNQTLPLKTTTNDVMHTYVRACAHRDGIPARRQPTLDHPPVRVHPQRSAYLHGCAWSTITCSCTLHIMVRAASHPLPATSSPKT